MLGKQLLVFGGMWNSAITKQILDLVNFAIRTSRNDFYVHINCTQIIVKKILLLAYLKMYTS